MRKESEEREKANLNRSSNPLNFCELEKDSAERELVIGEEKSGMERRLKREVRVGNNFPLAKIIGKEEKLSKKRERVSTENNKKSRLGRFPSSGNEEIPPFFWLSE